MAVAVADRMAAEAARMVAADLRQQPPAAVAVTVTAAAAARPSSWAAVVVGRQLYAFQRLELQAGRRLPQKRTIEQLQSAIE